MGDAGLTGRKIIVDTYGGMARHGGGAFSGKDPSKVDRSAAYAARYVAKNVVAAGLADRCEVQVAYAIGVAHPVSVMVETFGTEKIGRSKILELINEHFDLRPGAFREYLHLHRPIFQKTAAYGHFGREDHDFTWERTDKAEALREAAGLGAAAGVAYADFAQDFLFGASTAAHQVEGGDANNDWWAWWAFDNFDWNEGYRPRFGMLAVDRDDLRRVPLPSARVYGELARTRSLAMFD